MSVTVAAALKKVSVAVLSNKIARNKLGVLVLSILVGLFMPMAAVIGVFGGEMDFDDEDVQAVIDRLEYGDFDRLIKMQEKMDELGDAMRDAGYGDWLNMFVKDPHDSLLRIDFSFDHTLDDAFMVDIKKSRIQLNETIYEYIL